MKEETKRRIIKGVVAVGWAGTAAISLATLFGFLDPASRGARMGALFIVIALWGGIARSRYILSDTITAVATSFYRAGVAARQAEQEAKPSPNGESAANSQPEKETYP